MKHAKRIMAMALVIITIVAMMALPASAANTSDTTSTVTVTAAFLRNRPFRPKENTSAIYLLINSAGYEHTYVQAQATTSDGNDRRNFTVVDGDLVTNVVCRRGVKYSVHTSIYESGYRYAALDFKHLNTTTSTTSLNYTWSPDSTREYAYAT